MSSKIDITINGVELEVEIDGEAPEPSNGIQGGWNIVAVRRKDVDIWPYLKDFETIEDMIVEAIEREAEKRRQP